MGILAYQGQTQPASEDNTMSSVDSGPEHELVVEPRRYEFSSGEELEVAITLHNRGEEDIQETFSTSCTQPELFVNGQSMGGSENQACLEVITDVTIPAGDSTRWETSIPASAFAEGENQLTAMWASFESEPITVEKTD
jgi:hypothetical protein